MKFLEREIEEIGTQSGFTLLELLIAILIMAIIAASSINHYQDLGASFHRWNARTFIVQDLRYAQAKAISEGCRAIIQVDAGNAGYSIGCDYLDYDTTAPLVNDTVFYNRVLPNGITINPDATVIFNPKGQIINSAGALESRIVTLSYTEGGHTGVYFTANILATGVFTIN